jgi:hypothetical protein
MSKAAEAALRYAALGWPVCPGESRPTAAQRGGDWERACSCDRVGCPAPGAHPVSPAWQTVATIDPVVITSWWLAAPAATVILVTGRAFDVLDVPAAVGMTALARMERWGVRPGPVAISPGDRAHFFVRSRGAPDDENEWWSCHLDCEPEQIAEVAELRWHCRSSYVVAPPSPAGTGAPCRWLRDPRAFELPDGLGILEILSDVCEEARTW